MYVTVTNNLDLHIADRYAEQLREALQMNQIYHWMATVAIPATNEVWCAQLWRYNGQMSARIAMRLYAQLDMLQSA